MGRRFVAFHDVVRGRVLLQDGVCGGVDDPREVKGTSAVFVDCSWDVVRVSADR